MAPIPCPFTESDYCRCHEVAHGLMIGGGFIHLAQAHGVSSEAQRDCLSRAMVGVERIRDFNAEAFIACHKQCQRHTEKGGFRGRP